MPYSKVFFDAKQSSWDVPHGQCVVKLTFPKCDGDLAIHLIGVLERAVVDHGCVRDAWYKITTRNLPDRFLRVMNGRDGLRAMVKHYGFLDENECLNTRAAQLWLRPVHEVLDRLAAVGMTQVDVHRSARDALGVPQRLPNSGNCWFSSVCFSLLFNKHSRAAWLPKMPPHLRPLAERCLTDAQAAEELRRALWKEYAFGDPIDQPPEQDGQNGMTQIFILASQLGVPIQRVLMASGQRSMELTDPVRDMRGHEYRLDANAKPGDPHFLVLRFRRGNHSTDVDHQPTPVLTRGGRKYKLISMLIGSEHCGHQIASASPGSSAQQWAMSDSDGRRLGMGPVHWSIDPAKGTSKEQALQEWWKAWRSMIPAINFAGGVCDLSPHNRPFDELTKLNENVVHVRSTTEKTIYDPTAGLTNIDLMYMSRA